MRKGVQETIQELENDNSDSEIFEFETSYIENDPKISIEELAWIIPSLIKSKKHINIDISCHFGDTTNNSTSDRGDIPTKGDIALGMLCQAITKNPKISSLIVNCEPLSSDGITSLCTSLQESDGLAYLEISGGSLTNESSKRLSNFLKNNNIPITSLEISRNPIECSGLKSICESLKTNTKLNFLDITDIRAGAEAHKSIIEMLKFNHTLTIIDHNLFFEHPDEKLNPQDEAEIDRLLQINKAIAKASEEEKDNLIRSKTTQPPTPNLGLTTFFSVAAHLSQLSTLNQGIKRESTEDISESASKFQKP